MKYFSMTPKVKKSFVEIFTYEKEINNKKVVIEFEIGWKTGSLKIEVPETKEEIKDFLPDTNDDEYEAYYHYATSKEPDFELL